jgi:hypothetical protein
MNTNLTQLYLIIVIYKSEFSGADAHHTDFKTSYNYSIDPKDKSKRPFFKMK